MTIHYRDDHGAQDYTLARKYANMLLTQPEDRLGNLFLAKIYENGQGVETDFARALEHYKIAAMDSAEAQYLLGKMYLEGRGTAVNKNEAIKYFKLGAKNYSSESETELKKLGIEYEK